MEYRAFKEDNIYFYDQHRIVRSLPPGVIFVFGSNERGIHGLGAAFTARKYFGAELGKGEGLVGQSYGIPTKVNPMRVLPLERIKTNVDRFIAFANSSPHTYFVTPIGTGYAGYCHGDIAPLFKDIKRAWVPMIWSSVFFP